MQVITGFAEIIIPLDNQTEGEFAMLEEVMEDNLSSLQLGEVSGSGIGMGFKIFDVDIYDSKNIEEVIAVIKSLLLTFGVPAGTVIKINQPVSRLENIF